MRKSPLIGVSLDAEGPGGFSMSPWYAVRQNYCSSISDAGGLPVALPHTEKAAEEYADRLQGLVITGGGFDIPPSYYGGAEHSEQKEAKLERTEFEFAIAKAMLQRNKPVLGICGGQQLLTVLLGGSLIQHVPDEVENALNHEQEPPYNHPSHGISIKDGSLLHRIVGQLNIQVNSDHHQATKSVPSPVVISAVATDGVIEAIEDPRYYFCLGVVWHPEHHSNIYDQKIFKALVSEAIQLSEEQS